MEMNGVQTYFNNKPYNIVDVPGLDLLESQEVTTTFDLIAESRSSDASDPF
jgi:hypothetical protein